MLCASSLVGLYINNTPPLCSLPDAKYRNSLPFVQSDDPENLQSTLTCLYYPHHSSNMPAIRHASKRKPPPEGFSDIEDDLLIFSNKMKDAQNTPTDNIPKHQAQWPIFQISHQRSRYIYELYYEKEAISKKLYDWLLKNGYADAMLIAKWKKQGYEKVCAGRLHPVPSHDSRRNTRRVLEHPNG